MEITSEAQNPKKAYSSRIPGEKSELEERVFGYSRSTANQAGWLNRLSSGKFSRLLFACGSTHEEPNVALVSNSGSVPTSELPMEFR
jgi:hypothetical protein